MKIAIIGTGWGARVQVPAFRSAGLKIVGIAAQNYEKTQREAATLEVEAFENWRDLLSSDADLISIVTPPGTHCEMSVAALQAGKHVLCEKPTALNQLEAQTMLEAAQAHPEQLSLIDHELRFLPIFQMARALINDNAIGQIRHVNSSVIFSSRADPQRPWNWWSDKEQAGGAWGAIGSHQIDMLRWLCGDFSSIRASLHTFVGERPLDDQLLPVTSDDFATAQVRLVNGGFASVMISGVAALNENDRMIIHGEHGAIKIEGARLWHAERDGEWQERTPAHTVAIPSEISGNFPVGTVYLGHALKAYSRGQHDALAQAATFADGLLTQTLLDAAHRSDENDGGWIAI